jgi:hypothetical protein
LNEQEAATYYHWLAIPEVILGALDSAFVTRHKRIKWGKLEYAGTPRE